MRLISCRLAIVINVNSISLNRLIDLTVIHLTMVQSYVSLGKSDLRSVLACMTVHHPCAYGIQLTLVTNFNIFQSPDCNLQQPVFDREFSCGSWICFMTT